VNLLDEIFLREIQINSQIPNSQNKNSRDVNSSLALGGIKRVGQKARSTKLAMA
jgi:hypothetical protein